MSNPSDVQAVAGTSAEPTGSEGADRPAEGAAGTGPVAISPEAWEPHDPKLHEFDCEKGHLHVAPTCCATSCWCVAEHIARARSRIQAARQTLPEVPTFHEVVRHTNPKPPRTPKPRKRKPVSGADVRNSIVNALFRCTKESDFGLLEVILRESLAEVIEARESAKKISEQLDGLPAYMGTNEVAAFLGVKIHTIHAWRLPKKGGGPPFERFTGNRVRYRTEDVIAWTKQHVKVGSTWRSLEEHKRRTTQVASPREGLLTTTQAAAHLDVTPDVLRTWRKQNRGPEYIKLGKKLFAYRIEDLDRFRSWP